MRASTNQDLVSLTDASVKAFGKQPIPKGEFITAKRGPIITGKTSLNKLELIVQAQD